MNNTKIYTAQEMREAADTMDEYIKEMEDGNSMYWRDDHITSEDWKAMLRYAAEVVERREKEIEATKGEQMADDMNPRLEDGTPAVPLMAKRGPKKAGQSESVPLAACPFCGSRDIDGTGYAVECNSCGASTRLCASNEEAAESWNARMIPSPMHKTEAGIKDVQDFLYFEAFVVSMRNRISQSDVPGSMVADRDEVALAYAASVWPSRERP